MCKCVFYNPTHNASGGSPWNLIWTFWNAKMKSTNWRAQRVDEKNGIICLVIMFTPRIIVIKISKNVIFSADDSKESVSLGEILKCIWKISFDSFRKCYGLLDSELPLARCQPLKTQDFSVFFAGSLVSLIFLPSISHEW